MNTKQRLEVMKEIETANKRHVEKWKAQQQEPETMRAVYVDVYGSGKAKVIRIKRNLQEYYRLLHCNTVDMPFRWVDGKQFVFICDDEGLFRSDCRPSARRGSEVMLVGNLLIVAFDGKEDIRGLTRKEAQHIMKNVLRVVRLGLHGAEIWDTINNVTYQPENR